MNFVDKVTISVKAGDGGDGRLSFRHERFIAKGGPDGGDGGDGGDIILQSDNNQDTLTAFRYQKELVAAPGGDGGKNNRHGKNGEKLLINVPIGTIATDESGQILADLTTNHQQQIIAKGGKGGYGNAHFISSSRQAPNFAEKGEPGETLSVTLELKMIADVGLIGLPNAGKSTLLSKISNARPEIADYPFTTLSPNLGVVDIDRTQSILMADIPGLIEGAAEGKGLGHDFLRHIERTKVILHLIDAYNEDVAKVYQTVRHELEEYQTDLVKRPEIIAITKVEGLDSEIIADLQAQLKQVAKKGTPILAISAYSGLGLSELIFALKDTLKQLNRAAADKAQAAEPDIPVIRLKSTAEAFTIEKVGSVFLVSGPKIEHFVLRTDFSNTEAVSRLKNIMLKEGIMHELVRQGIKPDQIIRFPKGQEITY